MSEEADTIPTEDVPPDEQAVAALVAQLPAPLAPAEVEHLREIAYRAAEAATDGAEFIAATAERKTQTTQEEANMRAALSHYYMVLLVEMTQELERANKIVH